MELKWKHRKGPRNTQELADEVEREGILTYGVFVSKIGVRCLWGVIEDWVRDKDRPQGEEIYPQRELGYNQMTKLFRAGCSFADNDRFGMVATPEELCQEMARRLRAID